MTAAPAVEVRGGGGVLSPKPSALLSYPWACVANIPSLLPVLKKSGFRGTVHSVARAQLPSGQIQSLRGGEGARLFITGNDH